MPLSAQNMKMLVTEIYIMKESKHPAIVEYFDCFVADDQIWVFRFTKIIEEILSKLNLY